MSTCFSRQGPARRESAPNSLAQIRNAITCIWFMRWVEGGGGDSDACSWEQLPVKGRDGSKTVPPPSPDPGHSPLQHCGVISGQVLWSWPRARAPPSLAAPWASMAQAAASS